MSVIEFFLFRFIIHYAIYTNETRSFRMSKNKWSKLTLIYLSIIFINVTYPLIYLPIILINLINGKKY